MQHPPPPVAVVITERSNRHAVLSVTGDLDLDTSPVLRDELQQLLDEGCHRLVVDLSQLSFCDSTGLAVFVHANNQLHDHPDGAIHLAGLQPIVFKAFQITGLDSVLPCHPNLTDAVAACQVADAPAQGTPDR